MTTLDFTPLASPVTRQEIAAFRRERANTVALGSPVTSGVTIVVAIVLGAIALSIFLSIYSKLFSGGSFPVVLLATMLVAAGVFIAVWKVGDRAKWIRIVRLSRFAETNGLSYTADGLVPGYAGMIFGIGSARRVPERISRSSTPTVDVGNLDYTTGSGKNQTAHHWGYLAIKLDRMLPQMVLDAKSNNFFGSNLPTKFSHKQILSLEGNFDRYFTLYCPAEYERDALYVFTPDLMARLVDEAALFDVEIVDDWMFLYSAQPFDLTNATMLARIFRIVDTVGDRAVDRTERYADDRVINSAELPASATILGARMATNTVAREGRRLKHGIPVAGVIVVIALAAFWLLNILPMFSRF